MKPKNKKRGSVSTEYIIILCFIGAIASSFMSVDLTGALNDAVAEVHRALGIEKGYKYNANVTEEAKPYKEAIEAAIEYVRNSNLFSIQNPEVFGDNDVHQIAHVTFERGEIKYIWYYDPKDEATGNNRNNGICQYDNSLTQEQKEKFKSGLAKAIGDTGFTLKEPNSGALFFDKEGNFVYNDPSHNIGGQGRDNYFQFTGINGNGNNGFVKFEADGTWHYQTDKTGIRPFK